MRLSEPGETAVRLPWLSPGTAALVALARSGSAEVWPQAQAMGATTVHAVSLAQETLREALEIGLIRAFQPPLPVERKRITSNVANRARYSSFSRSTAAFCIRPSVDRK